MIIKYKSKVSLTIFVSFAVLLITPFILFQTVFAGCEDRKYNANPSGINPVSGSNQPSNCTSLSLMNNVEAVTRYSNGSCSPVTRVTYNFCAKDRLSIASSSGNVYIYHRPNADRNYYFFNSTTGQSQTRSGTDASPINMGISITAGQSYYFKPTLREWNDSPGWRMVNPSSTNSFIQEARADAAARGYTIIAEQVWADSSTCVRSDDPADGCSFYDTYDFDDLTVIIAVDNPEPIPSCASHAATLSVAATNGTTLYHGEQANFNASVPLPNNGSFRYEPRSNRFTVNGQAAPNFNISLNASPSYSGGCTPQAGVNSTVTTRCYINNRHGYDNSNYTSAATWIHTYRICNNTGCSPDCTAQSNVFTIYPYPGFLKTSQNGTAYTRGAITQSRFPDAGHFLSSRLFLSATANNQFIPANKLVPTTASNSIYSYSDSNNNPDFFNSLKTKLTADLRLNKIEYLSGTMPTINNTYLNTLANAASTNPVDLLYFNSSITISDGAIVNCRKPTIFLVNGNVNFNQQFRLQANSDSACLFIASGSVNFNTTGSDDRFDGFFIANNIQTSAIGKITIKGGVVGLNSSFPKNINANKLLAAEIQKTTPSEEVIYEGARYIKILGVYLSEPFKVSIREIQFVNN